MPTGRSTAVSYTHLDVYKRQLFVGECQFGGFVEQFRTLPVQSLVEEDTCEIDLFAQLHRHRALHVEQPDAHQYLFVKMRLHVGQLLLFDRAALQDALFVVFVQRVEAVEQREEFRFLVSGQTGGIELEVPLFGLDVYKRQGLYYRFVEYNIITIIDSANVFASSMRNKYF